MSKAIAITMTSAGGLDQPMDPRFGRAPVFLFVSGEGEEAQRTLTNEAVAAAHGAGTSAAALVAEQGAGVVISGRFGPKAAEALQALGVEMWLAPNGLTGREALQRYREGELERWQMKEYR